MPELIYIAAALMMGLGGLGAGKDPGGHLGAASAARQRPSLRVS